MEMIWFMTLVGYDANLLKDNGTSCHRSTQSSDPYASVGKERQHLFCL